MILDNYFILFANCIAVKGAKRGIICDLQRGYYVFVPNTLADLLIDSSKLSIKLLLEKYKSFTDQELNFHFDTLIKYDLGHFCCNPFNFPKINKNHLTPCRVHDCIIELSDANLKNIVFIFKSLTNLNCQILELRSYEQFPLDKIEIILDLLKATTIKNVELYIQHSPSNSDKKYLALLSKYPIISNATIHSCKVEPPKKSNNFNLFFTTQKINDSSCCGNISKEDFKINLSFYLEGLKNNTCLNKKLSITKEGLIKNCPSLSKSYGNVNNTSLEKVVNKKSFKYLWEINKDQINVCKDCEFRYICSDCRAFLNHDNDKPKKCNYNPYTMSYVT